MAKTPEDVASVLEATANSLRSKGFISEPERMEILEMSQNLGNVIEAREKAARSLYVTMSKMFGYGGALGTGIYGIKKAFD